MKEWQAPTSVTEVRRFLGFTNFFRRFIKDYSVITRPLEELTGKYARFTWETGQEKAFRELREALLTAPVLKLADVNKPFRVMSDASDSAIGGVLLQQDEEGDWHPVAYTSRRLRPEERNYHAMERETLAAIHAIRTWKLYLQARTRGGGGGFTVANEPPWKFQVSFQNQRHARLLRASTLSRSITAVFHRMRICDVHSCNFQGSDRCRARKTV